MSRYSSGDLTEFEFHDAWAEEIRREGEALTCRVKHLNLHPSAPEPPYPQDMELGQSVLTLSGFQVRAFCLPGYESRSPEGKTEIQPEQRFFGVDAEKRFSQAVAEGLRLYGVYRPSSQEPAHWTLEAQGRTEPYFTLTFSFRRALVEWEEFAGKAWYVNFHSGS